MFGEVEHNKFVEDEQLYEKGSEEIIEPFDPKKVDIVKQTMVISNIVERLRNNEIVLDPDYQRNCNLWDDIKQSRLIESLIVRIPLPSFYFEYGENDEYIVVDGLQRLWTINRFAVLDRDRADKLRLKGLEYLKEYENFCFEDLPRNIQRRILEQEILAYVIRPGTPENVKNSIFQRINTGGMVLTQAEIRNAVYRGTVAQLLKHCAECREFIDATCGKISNKRMLDRDFAVRFVAFCYAGCSEYKGNLEEYYNYVLPALKKENAEVLDEIYNNFRDVMGLAHSVFGEKAFKRLNKDGRFGNINKPLFECVSVQLGRLTEEERKILKNNKNYFLEDYYKLLRDKDFVSVISSATASIARLKKRHEAMAAILRKWVK